ncbi:TorF family putative porin [Shewanella marina]|uniref:TorF family putative porin n=1 Tax=Shewanella marina TaxID=487319 RepID=UPI00046E6E93|nr:TorF family putative porin [Shewanella marina]
MNPLLVSLIGTLVILPTSSYAQWSANIGASSNYLWRGVSQTQDAAAIQGGIDYQHQSGFYLGSWASNIDFGDDTSYELDFYTGYSGQITQQISYDFSYLHYGYPDADANIDFGELKAALEWHWLWLQYSYVINAGDNVTAPTLDNRDLRYVEALIRYPISDTLTLSAHYGYSSGDVVQAWYNTNNYSDYRLSLSKSTAIGDVSFTLADTDLADDDGKFIISWSYSFDM